jgi:antitoxin (DNA-binding transcriptional repressor) of toxin-antitoxin stability system
MTVKRYTIHVAKTLLSRLIELACEGDEIVIARRDVPVVRLVPIGHQTAERKFGAMKGRAKTSAAFFEPLPDEEVERWG